MIGNFYYVNIKIFISRRVFFDFENIIYVCVMNSKVFIRKLRMFILEDVLNRCIKCIESKLVYSCLLWY